jgi:hypothetical protein
LGGCINTIEKFLTIQLLLWNCEKLRYKGFVVC